MGCTIYTDNFLYDGWNLIAILNSAFSLQNSFLWGNDLSGSQQGAGGVGGLVGGKLSRQSQRRRIVSLF